MIYCTDTPNKVMRYVDKKVAASYAALSRSYKMKVIYAFRENPIRTTKATKRLIDFAEKEGIKVFHKVSSHVFDKTSTTDILEELFLTTEKEIIAWINFEGVKQGDLIVVKHFNWIHGNLLKNVKSHLHFEIGEQIVFTDEWPTNVTVDRVKKIDFYSTSITTLPINDKKWVEDIIIRRSDIDDLSFLESFTRLKKLSLFNAAIESSSTPNLPTLEELYACSLNCFIKIESLRKLTIFDTVLNDSTATVISSQKRLLYLAIKLCKNAFAFKIPATVRSMQFNYEREEDEQFYVDLLADQCAQLELREFRTNAKLQTIEWLKKEKICTWEFNGLVRERLNGKWILFIDRDFDLKLPYLNRRADNT